MQPDCKICWSSIDTPVYWHNNSSSKIIDYCWDCAKEEHTTFFKRWKNSIDNADCVASFRRLITNPPPMTFADVIGDITAGSEDVYLQCGDERIAGHLIGAPENQTERDALWAQLKNFQF